MTLEALFTECYVSTVIQNLYHICHNTKNPIERKVLNTDIMKSERKRNRRNDCKWEEVSKVIVDTSKRMVYNNQDFWPQNMHI